MHLRAAFELVDGLRDHLVEAASLDDLPLCETRDFMIVVVALKQLLSAGATQREVVGLELLILDIAPLLVDVLLVEVVLQWRDERRFDAAVGQVIPGEVSQPGVVLHFFGAVVAQPVLRLALDHLHGEKTTETGPSPLTLFTKSAASVDQPRGMSLSLIWICLDRMWSRISFLDLPM